MVLVFFGKKAIISSLNNENQMMILRDDSNRVVTGIPLYDVRQDSTQIPDIDF